VLDLHRENTANSSLQKTAALLTAQMPIPGLNCSDECRNQLLPVAEYYEPTSSDPIRKVQRSGSAIHGRQANRSSAPEFVKSPEADADTKSSERLTDFMRTDRTNTNAAYFGSEGRAAEITFIELVNVFR
jgi:hypothetical protein